MGIDIKNFYLNTPMERPEYMKLSIKLTPQKIIDEYNLLPLVHNGHVYIRVTLLRERVKGDKSFYPRISVSDMYIDYFPLTVTFDIDCQIHHILFFFISKNF